MCCVLTHTLTGKQMTTSPQVNDHLVLIVGESSTGKSACLRELDHALYINCESGYWLAPSISNDSRITYWNAGKPSIAQTLQRDWKRWAWKFEKFCDWAISRKAPKTFVTVNPQRLAERRRLKWAEVVGISLRWRYSLLLYESISCT